MKIRTSIVKVIITVIAVLLLIITVKTVMLKSTVNAP